MASNLWKNINYRSKVPYIVNYYIREYDLSKANISCLLHYGVISVDEYNRIYAMPKTEREVLIGNMIRNDKDMYKYIKNGIAYARNMLFDSNQIEDFEVLSIKNDAVFTYGRELKYTSFEEFTFKEKNVYTTYMNLCGIEIYYKDFLDENGNTLSDITVKGISDDKVELHNNGILDIIGNVCYMIQRNDIRDILSYATNVYNDYRNRRLPINYYRTFDPRSEIPVLTDYFAYCVQFEDESLLPIVDVSANDKIFRDLLSIVFDIYVSKYGK